MDDKKKKEEPPGLLSLLASGGLGGFAGLALANDIEDAIPLSKGRAMALYGALGIGGAGLGIGSTLFANKISPAEGATEEEGVPMKPASLAGIVGALAGAGLLGTAGFKGTNDFLKKSFLVKGEEEARVKLQKRLHAANSLSQIGKRRKLNREEAERIAQEVKKEIVDGEYERRMGTAALAGLTGGVFGSSIGYNLGDEHPSEGIALVGAGLGGLAGKKLADMTPEKRALWLFGKRPSKSKELTPNLNIQDVPVESYQGRKAKKALGIVAPSLGALAGGAGSYYLSPFEDSKNELS